MPAIIERFKPYHYLLLIVLVLLVILGQLIYTSSAQASPSTPNPNTLDQATTTPMISTATPTNHVGNLLIPELITETITVTPTITLTPTPTPLPTEPPILFFPLIIRQPTPTPVPYVPPTTGLFCDSLSNSIYIPDDNPAGVEDTLNLLEPSRVMDLDVALDISHTWIGDLVVTLTHHDTGKTAVLIDRPGYPEYSQGCDQDDIKTILDDQISSYAEFKCSTSPAAISGIYLPSHPLSIFNGDPMAGRWTLNVSDQYRNDSGRLNGWCLIADVSPAPAPPTPTPTIPSLPADRILGGVTGRDQALPLDCESRSAVDWAAYLGQHINELTFFNRLPKSDNPDKGFVGNVYGAWGQIPPNPYGVHADPVAALLRDYGLPAYAHRPLRWEQLQAEIAAGRPVFVWIIGNVINGIPVYYIPSDGLATIVARYEHTVVVTGYSENYVYYLNGDTIYTRPVWQFLDSWSALGNMAITTQP